MDAIQPIKPRLLTLVDFHDPVLRQVTEPVHFPLSDKDKQLIADMKYSIQPAQLKAANAPWESAGGMAANQWGFNKRIFLFCPDGDSVHGLEVMINPSYESLNETITLETDKDMCWEGCFSVPLATGNVKRYTSIRATYQDETGKIMIREFSGRSARVFQHETDHLNGRLYYELDPKQCIDKRNFSSKEDVDDFYDAIYEARKKSQEDFISCPCGSSTDFKACCGLYIEGGKFPATPEALMRSRYSAYSRANMDYILKTMRGPALLKFDKRTDPKYPQEWLGLEVLTAYNDLDPNIGYVEFIAKYKQHNKVNVIHELSKFHREDGRWYYVDGEYLG